MKKFLAFFRSYSNLILLLVGLAWLTPTLHFILYRIEVPSPDFSVYWETARRLLAGDFGSIYAPTGAMVFRYSPFTLAFFAPLGVFSPPQARAFWVVIQFSSTVLSLLFMTQIIGGLFHLTSVQKKWSFTLAALLIYRYYLANLRSGQITPVTVLIGTIGLHCWFRGRQRLGVALLIARSFFKILPGLWIFPIVIIQKKASLRTLLHATFLAILFGGILSAFFVDIDELVGLPMDWIHLVFNHHEQYRSPTTYSQSLPSVILRLIQAGHLPAYGYWPILGTLAALILLAATQVWKTLQTDQPQVQLGILTSAALLIRLIAPDNFPYANLPLIFPIFFFIAKAWRDPRYSKLLAVFAIFLSFPGRDTLPEFVFNSYREHSVPFLVRAFIFFSFLVLLRQENRPVSHATGVDGSKDQTTPSLGLPR